MQIGIYLPVGEMQNDLAAIREFTQTAEELSLTHLRIADLVTRPGAGHRHEALTLLTWIAGFTERIELVPAVINMPARQTVLLAKQAAEIDILSGGRRRFGIGVGSRPEEYQALGQDFTICGRRAGGPTNRSNSSERFGKTRRLTSTGRRCFKSVDSASDK